MYLSQQSSSGRRWRRGRSWRWWTGSASRLPGRGSGVGASTHSPADTHTHTANEENVVSGVEKKNKYVFSHSARLRHDLVSISCELTLGARVRAGIPLQKRTHKICVKETPGGSEEALCDPFLLNISCEHHQTPAHTPPPPFLCLTNPSRPRSPCFTKTYDVCMH